MICLVMTNTFKLFDLMQMIMKLRKVLILYFLNQIPVLELLQSQAQDQLQLQLYQQANLQLVETHLQMLTDGLSLLLMKTIPRALIL